MSTIATSSLSDTLLSTALKLNTEGENWATFYVHFMNAIEAKGFWGHFDGLLPEPEMTCLCGPSHCVACTSPLFYCPNNILLIN